MRARTAPLASVAMAKFVANKLRFFTRDSHRRQCGCRVRTAACAPFGHDASPKMGPASYHNLAVGWLRPARPHRHELTAGLGIDRPRVPSTPYPYSRYPSELNRLGPPAVLAKAWPHISTWSVNAYRHVFLRTDSRFR